MENVIFHQGLSKLFSKRVQNIHFFRRVGGGGGGGELEFNGVCINLLVHYEYLNRVENFLKGIKEGTNKT